MNTGVDHCPRSLKQARFLFPTDQIQEDEVWNVLVSVKHRIHDFRKVCATGNEKLYAREAFRELEKYPRPFDRIEASHKTHRWTLRFLGDLWRYLYWIRQ